MRRDRPSWPTRLLYGAVAANRSVRGATGEGPLPRKTARAGKHRPAGRRSCPRYRVRSALAEKTLSLFGGDERGGNTAKKGSRSAPAVTPWPAATAVRRWVEVAQLRGGVPARSRTFGDLGRSGATFPLAGWTGMGRARHRGNSTRENPRPSGGEQGYSLAEERKKRRHAEDHCAGKENRWGRGARQRASKAGRTERERSGQFGVLSLPALSSTCVHDGEPRGARAVGLGL